MVFDAVKNSVMYRKIVRDYYTKLATELHRHVGSPEEFKNFIFHHTKPNFLDQYYTLREDKQVDVELRDKLLLPATKYAMNELYLIFLKLFNAEHDSVDEEIRITVGKADWNVARYHFWGNKQEKLHEVINQANELFAKELADKASPWADEVVVILGNKKSIILRSAALTVGMQGAAAWNESFKDYSKKQPDGVIVPGPAPDDDLSDDDAPDVEEGKSATDETEEEEKRQVIAQQVIEDFCLALRKKFHSMDENESIVAFIQEFAEQNADFKANMQIVGNPDFYLPDGWWGKPPADLQDWAARIVELVKSHLLEYIFELMRPGMPAAIKWADAWEERARNKQPKPEWTPNSRAEAFADFFFIQYRVKGRTILQSLADPKNSWWMQQHIFGHEGEAWTGKPAVLFEGIEEDEEGDIHRSFRLKGTSQKADSMRELFDIAYRKVSKEKPPEEEPEGTPDDHAPPTPKTPTKKPDPKPGDKKPGEESDDDKSDDKKPEETPEPSEDVPKEIVETVQREEEEIMKDADPKVRRLFEWWKRGFKLYAFTWWVLTKEEYERIVKEHAYPDCPGDMKAGYEEMPNKKMAQEIVIADLEEGHEKEMGFVDGKFLGWHGLTGKGVLEKKVDGEFVPPFDVPNGSVVALGAARIQKFDIMRFRFNSLNGWSLPWSQLSWKWDRWTPKDWSAKSTAEKEGESEDKAEKLLKKLLKKTGGNQTLKYFKPEDIEELPELIKLLIDAGHKPKEGTADEMGQMADLFKKIEKILRYYGRDPNDPTKVIERDMNALSEEEAQEKLHEFLKGLQEKVQSRG